MHITRRLGFLSLVPLGGVLALVALILLIAATAATDTGTAALVIFPAVCVLAGFGLLAALWALIYFIVHIARREDFTPADKATWIVVIFLAGVFGPPIYWLATVRGKR